VTKNNVEKLSEGTYAKLSNKSVDKGVGGTHEGIEKNGEGFAVRGSTLMEILMMMMMTTMMTTMTCEQQVTI
jgi:hypothetical protein